MSSLSRRIINRSFAISRSYKESKPSESEFGFFSSRRYGAEEDWRGERCDGDDGGQGDGSLTEESNDNNNWSRMLPELLDQIIRRVEESEEEWPQRQNVVVCGCVCKQWREVTVEAVERTSISQPGRITFPSSLKKPGPRDSPTKCLIKRDKKNASFYLYLALTPSFTEKGKFLLAARRYRNGAHTEYIISLDADDLSQGSKAYVGKLRSDFLGTNFIIYDSQPPYSGAKPSSSRSIRRVANKQISPQVPSGNFEVGQISYKFNLLKSRGPRRMVCSITCPSSSSPPQKHQNDPKMKNNNLPSPGESSSPSTTILKNKAPRWHEHLECWCLNFHGRVTVASVKNFQLVEESSADQNQKVDETVLLQFGKVGNDIFTMDFRQPLSAFQAFAICLSSFGTKLACE